MTPLFFLLALPAFAQERPEISAKQEPAGFYRVSGRHIDESDIVGRRSMTTTDTLDAEARYLYCAVPPAADWVLDVSDESIEQKYHLLVARLFHIDASAHGERGGSVIGLCGSLRSPTPTVDLQRMQEPWFANCKNSVQARQAGRYTCTQHSGGRVVPPGLPIIQTLKALAKSSRPKTAVTAMNLMEEVKGRDKLFAPTVSAILRDEKTPLAVRERAAEVLASVLTNDDLAAHTLASVWGSDTNPESLRRAALRGYALMLGFSDSRRGSAGQAAPGEAKRCHSAGLACDRLRRYLRPLLALVNAETKEGKDGKDKLTPLGEDALCATRHYGSRWGWYAKRHENWYEVMKADEAKGLDQSQPDGKLKPG